MLAIFEYEAAREAVQAFTAGGFAGKPGLQAAFAELQRARGDGADNAEEADMLAELATRSRVMDH